MNFLITALMTLTTAHAAPTVVSIPGNAFRTMETYDSEPGIGADAWGVLRPLTANNTHAIASIQLPHEAEVTDFVCTLRDRDAKGRINISIRRSEIHAVTFGYGKFDTVASIYTPVAKLNRWFTGVDGTVKNPHIDNHKYTYYMNLSFVDISTATNELGWPDYDEVLAIHSCRIYLDV